MTSRTVSAPLTVPGVAPEATPRGTTDIRGLGGLGMKSATVALLGGGKPATVADLKSATVAYLGMKSAAVADLGMFCLDVAPEATSRRNHGYPWFETDDGRSFRRDTGSLVVGRRLGSSSPSKKGQAHENGAVLHAFSILTLGNESAISFAWH